MSQRERAKNIWRGTNFYLKLHKPVHTTHLLVEFLLYPEDCMNLATTGAVYFIFLIPQSGAVFSPDFLNQRLRFQNQRWKMRSKLLVGLSALFLSSCVQYQGRLTSE